MNKFMKKIPFLLFLILILSSCGSPSTSSSSLEYSSQTSSLDVTSSSSLSSDESSSEKESSTLNSSSSISVHEHTFSDKYEHDEVYHWYSSTCGHEETEEKKPHVFNSVVTNPTFEEGGHTTYTCTECDYSYEDDKTNPLEHNYSKKLSFDDKTHWYACTDLGYEHLKKDEKPHTFNSKVTQPTYENKGYTTYTCKYCEYTYVGNETDVLKHNYSNTLTYDDKTHWYACTDLGYEHLKKGEASHIFNSKITQPTYENRGFTTYSCRSCTYSYISDFTNALKHNYSSVLTYDEYNHWYACTDLGYENLKKDEKAHDFEVTVTAPTYFDKGYTTYQCKYCEYGYRDNYKDVLKHTITYNLDGGVNSSFNPLTFTVEDEIFFRSASKDGFAFLGWFDKDGNYVSGIEKGTNVDIEIYAKWADVFTIEGNRLVSVDGTIPVFQIDIPSGVTTIGANAFSDCEYISVISIPESVIKIETGAFDGCSNLYSVIYKGTLDTWSQITFEDISSTPMSVAYDFYMIDSNQEYYEVTEIVLSNNVTEVKKYAFSGFSRVTTLTLSKNVTKLNYFSFKGCTSLTTINFDEESRLTTIGESAFYGCSSLEYVNIPNGVETIEDYAFEECDLLTTINLPSTLKTIGEGVFKNNSSLTSISIPTGVSKIAEYTFSGCDSLATINLPSTLKTIEGYSFTSCAELEKLDIPSGVTSIGDFAFYSCDEIKSIRIPSTVTSIGIDAFDGCSMATIYCQAKSKPSGWDTSWNPSFCTVYWGKSSSDIYENNGIEYIIYNSTGYVSASLDINEHVVLEGNINIKGASYSVTTIGESAFSSGSKMKSIVLPSSITKIEDYAFSGSELEYIVIPSSVKTIGRYAFYLCFGLVIYCEASASSSSWNSEWNPQNCPVYYKNNWEYDTNGIPKVINQ